MIMSHEERKERRRNMAQDYDQGMTMPEICEKYGCESSLVYASLHEFDIPLRPRTPSPSRPLGISTYQILDRLINTNTNLANIAREFGVRRQYIHQIYAKARKHNIPVKIRSRSKKK